MVLCGSTVTNIVVNVPSSAIIAVLRLLDILFSFPVAVKDPNFRLHGLDADYVIWRLPWQLWSICGHTDSDYRRVMAFFDSGRLIDGPVEGG